MTDDDPMSAREGEDIVTRSGATEAPPEPDEPFLPEGLRPDDGRLAPQPDPSGGQRGPAVRTDGRRGRDNRGSSAPPEGSGVVVGSGASAGGRGGEEDFASDPVGGGGGHYPGKGDGRAEGPQHA